MRVAKWGVNISKVKLYLKLNFVKWSFKFGFFFLKKKKKNSKRMSYLELYDSKFIFIYF